jgi:hypothetical protein
MKNTTHERLEEIFGPIKESKFMARAKWMQRNRWWRRPWLKFQIFYFDVKDKIFG